MLVMLSPAKTMNMSLVEQDIPHTTPLYAAEAEFLAERMQKYSVIELARLLKVSDRLAEESFQRYRRFGSLSSPRKQAIIAYDGTVFKAMDTASFTDADFEYAQEHVRIVSTLYGSVRPLDLIQAYRIAYTLKLDKVEGKNLYDYWRPKLTRLLIEDVRKAGGILVNLASLDILGALRMDQINEEVRVITPEFQEFRNGKWEPVRTYAKMARGRMTGYIIRDRIEDPEDLKSFSWKGFAFDTDLSDERHYIFTRERY